ncbi:iron-sulfur cluster-binding domain-containing protein [Shewanella sp. AS16]|uniref:flavin reductase family protein n=1 Tax=Shewanella sp. AS16 TaxID=2907625 RepID=UPI001F402D3B|nr:iron-sulfur cluster-binding domain-containing protein [Shewanella sp. AS16]MCE9685719.1 iron-sulfur cluster-binding domain-containing protein [Shewanella sp. AS16]
MENQAICKEVKQDVAGVKTFVFETETIFTFLPGQFITLTLPTQQGPLLRSYTLSSSPKNDNFFSITVRAVPNGKGSNWLHQYLEPGMSLTYTGAYGRFIPAEYETQKLLLLAAGSGITPHLSTLRTWRDKAVSVDAHLIFSVRSPDQIIEYYELLSLANSIKGLTLTILPEILDNQSWHGISGRLDALWLTALCRDIAERQIFTCGPTPYMQAIKKYLTDQDIGLSRYHEEAFVSPDFEVSVPATVNTETNSFSVHFAKSDIKVSTQGQESLLDLAEKAGIKVKNACRAGICGACRTFKKSGNVNMKDLGGILPNEVNQGMVLMCCSKPTSDLVLDI